MRLTRSPRMADMDELRDSKKTLSMDSAMEFAIGTRKSKLAVIQSEQISGFLSKAYPQFTFPIKPTSAMGDLNQVKALYDFNASDAKGLWTKELEVLLMARGCRLVVHCLKDMPTTLPHGMKIAMIGQGEDARDVVVMADRFKSKYKTLADLPPGAVVGTSSIRRIAQIKRHFPDLVFADVRGNIQTRLAKLNDENHTPCPYHCLILAAAGLNRLDLQEIITEYLEAPVMYHSPGQGALAIEILEDDLQVQELLNPLDHWVTRVKTSCERSMMRYLQGGCSVPIGCETHFMPLDASTPDDQSQAQAGTLTMTAIVISLDGAKHVSHTSSAELSAKEGETQAEALGVRIAQEMIRDGAKALLEAIESERNQEGRQGDREAELREKFEATADSTAETSNDQPLYLLSQGPLRASGLGKREMKFSHSLQFNAVPEWSDNYIAYSNLKKLIYVLEKSHVHGISEGLGEEETLLAVSDEELDARFVKALDKELQKCDVFYQRKEEDIYSSFTDLDASLEEFESEQGDTMNTFGGSTKTRRESGSKKRRKSSSRRRSQSQSAGSSDRDGAQESLLSERTDQEAVLASAVVEDRNPFDEEEDEDPFDDIALYEAQIALKKRVISLYVSLSELKSYVTLNATGFTKALKKYDKTLGRLLKSQYVEKVNSKYPFTDNTKHKLNDQIAKVTSHYARVTQIDIETARKELRTYLREHVVWERNTVWREMIGIERRAQAASVNPFRPLIGGNTVSGEGSDGSIEDLSKMVETPLGRYLVPRFLLNSTLWTLMIIVVIFFVLLWSPMLAAEEQSNCLALLIFVSLMWATEAIPLFVTSLMVPLLVVLLRVVRSDDEKHIRLEAPAATKYIFAAMWTPTIMLLLGGFSIAAALSKYHIAKLLATTVLSKVGTNPKWVLLANMFVAWFASMWISNVAAPVLCFSIITPILRTLPNGSEFAKCLIIGIALASNVGGMASPIASPQNIVALQNMSPPPSWGQWFFISIPVCVLSILAIWALLLMIFKPGKETTIQPIRASKDKFTGVQWFISIVTLVVIVLWCVERNLENVFGDMGVVAILPLVIFFGTGILTKEDFNNFLWTVIVLAMGGIALGKAVSSSGLLQTIAIEIREGVDGMALYSVYVIFAALVMVIATFISHTVAALIVLPIVAQVGASMDDPHPRLLVMGAAMMASAAMGLPTSGFPNMTAIMMENEVGVRYLSVKDFLKSGLPASLLTFIVVTTVGFLLTRIVGL